MRAAGTRVSFKFEMPSRIEQGSGVIAADGEDGFLVLDDVRLDSGKSAARVWIPLTKLRLLWADELPAAPAAGSAVTADTRVGMGDVVLDRDSLPWAMFSDGRLRSGHFDSDYALGLFDLIDLRGPITFRGHDNDEAGN